MKKRILVLLSVVALMVVMLAMSVAPAFAKWETEGPSAGCRTQGVLVPDRFPPDLSPDGKRSDDNSICESESGSGLIHIYDNRPVTLPPTVS
jgi:hypothetical protein